MFCPACRVEYRLGFTRCADCDVELVHSLDGIAPPQPQLSDEPPPPDENLILLWRGEDPVFFGWLVHELQDAGIACHVRRRSTDTAMPVYYQPSAHQAAEVRVFHHDVVAARRILEQREKRQQDYLEERDRLGPQATDDDEPVAEVLIDYGRRPADEDVLIWRGEDAGMEVWSGDDSAHAKYFRDAFRELGIGYRTDVEPGGGERIFTEEADATRAREVIQAILEPPELAADGEMEDSAEETR